MITLGMGERAETTKIALRRVSGAQAIGARERLGLIKITKPSAKALWEKGIVLVLVGNQVNDAHFFSGWRLALLADSKRIKEEMTFEAYINNFEFYMERELGRRVCFFVFADQLRIMGVAVSPTSKRGVEL